MSSPSVPTASTVIKTSETGKTAAAGFTILEILLVLFLISMIGTIFVVNIDTALRNQEEATVEAAFWEASREARIQALYSRRPVTLTYEPEASTFHLTSGGAALNSFSAAGVTSQGDPITVQFVQERASNEVTLIRGRLVDTWPIEQVIFYPDGSCTSFWVELNFGSQQTRQIRIDPWTGAEILSKTES